MINKCIMYLHLPVVCSVFGCMVRDRRLHIHRTSSRFLPLHNSNFLLGHSSSEILSNKALCFQWDARERYNSGGPRSHIACIYVPEYIHRRIVSKNILAHPCFCSGRAVEANTSFGLHLLEHHENDPALRACVGSQHIVVRFADEQRSKPH